MKKLVLALSALMLVFAFAGCSKATKLEIQNFSSFTLFNVQFKGTSFGTLTSGSSVTEEVDSGSDYVYFDFLDAAFRTKFPVKVDSKETTTFALTNDTLVVGRSAGSRGVSGEGAPIALGSLSK